jgi:hypothetical protein
MKKAFTFLMAFAIAAQSLATVTPKSAPGKPGPLRASEIFIPISKGKVISLEYLAHMKPADYTKLTGKKMKFFDRVGFKIAQKKLRSSINADGTITSLKMNNTLRKMQQPEDLTSGFHLGGAALGFFLSLIGVLIAYLINDDMKRSRVKWAWIGAAVGLVFWILIGAVI